MDQSIARIIQDVLNQLQQSAISLSQLIIYALQQYPDPSNPLMCDLIQNTRSIASAFYYNTHTTQIISTWAHELKCVQYTKALQLLAREDNGWHFHAAHTQPDQIRDFQIKDMVVKMHMLAPELCDLVRRLLGSEHSEELPVEVMSDDEDELYEVDIDVNADLPESVSEPDRGPSTSHQKTRGKKVLRHAFVKIVCDYNNTS